MFYYNYERKWIVRIENLKRHGDSTDGETELLVDKQKVCSTRNTDDYYTFYMRQHDR